MEGWANWQKRLEFGIFVIWPPDEIRMEINKLREEYDPVSQSYCEAHITLSTPLKKELNSADWSQLADICRRVEPFEIKYGPPKVFELKPVVYLAVFPESELKELYVTFLDICLFCDEPPPPFDFVPHMTISEFGVKTDEEAKKLKNRLEKISISGCFICDSVAFIKPDENFHFSIHKTLPLMTP